MLYPQGADKREVDSCSGCVKAECPLGSPLSDPSDIFFAASGNCVYF